MSEQITVKQAEVLRFDDQDWVVIYNNRIAMRLTFEEYDQLKTVAYDKPLVARSMMRRLIREELE